jgi:hypothetical protein
VTERPRPKHPHIASRVLEICLTKCKSVTTTLRRHRTGPAPAVAQKTISSWLYCHLRAGAFVWNAAVKSAFKFVQSLYWRVQSTIGTGAAVHAEERGGDFYEYRWYHKNLGYEGRWPYRAEKLRRGSVLRYLGLLVISISKQMTLKMSQFESRYLFSGVPRQ